MKKIIKLAFSLAAIAVIPSQAQTIVSDGSLPLCKSGQVTKLALAVGYNGSIGSTPRFFGCFGGPKKLFGFVKSIKAIDSTNTSTIIYQNNISNPAEADFVDLINTPLDVVVNQDTSALLNGRSITITNLEITLDSRIKINGIASLDDQFNGESKRTCGTLLDSNKTFASPMNNSGGTFNARPSSFYQKNSSGITGTQGDTWYKLDAIPFLTSNMTGNGSSGGAVYQSDVTVSLDSNDSKKIDQVRIQILNSSGNLGGWSGNNPDSTDVKANMRLRTPIVIKPTSKFNLDIKLDFSRLLAWSFYYNKTSNNNPQPIVDIGHDNNVSCQNLTVGLILADIKKIAVKD